MSNYKNNSWYNLNKIETFKHSLSHNQATQSPNTPTPTSTTNQHQLFYYSDFVVVVCILYVLMLNEAEAVFVAFVAIESRRRGSKQVLGII